MEKFSFKNDYSEGCHPRILEALGCTNLVQEEGYGEDSLCLEAAGLIRDRIGNPAADVHFASGGTQANLIVLSSIMRPHESVIAATTGHIAVHEAGAIEATGHKINTIDT
ncbi:MAG: beta-eliminating lyase-related protein, partial [Candidatus Wallbacteria bacterium]|nr:beta-eliminating lyase-related protein [Candidatus Wallbacteria bacterium]